MVSSTTAIGIRDAAEAAITSHVVRAIDTPEYTDSTAQNLKNDLIAAVRNVPTTLAGGDNGHTYLLESQEDHHARTRTNKDYVEATRPAAISFSGTTTVADVAQLREGKTVKEETFHTQEGCIVGLRKAIISNVPHAILLEHFSTNDGFNLVYPRDLLATVLGNAAPVTVTDGRTLKEARDKGLTFHTNTPLSVQFAEAQRAIEQLLTLHAVPSSKAELMMLWLGDLEREKDFKDKVEEWKGKSSGKTLASFITFFASRDREVRRRNKIRTAAGSGYHSAANIREEDLEQRIFKQLETKMEIEMANLASRVADTVESVEIIEAPGPAGQPAPSVTAYAATAEGGASKSPCPPQGNGYPPPED